MYTVCMCTSLHRMIGDKHGKSRAWQDASAYTTARTTSYTSQDAAAYGGQSAHGGGGAAANEAGLACTKKQQLYKVTPCKSGSTARDPGFCVPSRTAETQLIILGIYKRQQVIVYLIACDMDLNHTI